MKPSTRIADLLTIMAQLRDPNSGCPWDIKQTFQSIKPYTLEEAYEVADAIEREDPDDLCDELGDLLLQVVFHAQMAKEQGLFSFDDVVLAITKKMIRRHPHIFSDGDAQNADQVKLIWDEIKLEEKRERAEKRRARGLEDDRTKGYLDTVSRMQPANDEALALQKKAAKVGFDWDDAALVLDKMEEEIGELRAEIAAGRDDEIASEMGDLMFVLVNLARHFEVNPEMALRGTNEKVRKRFSYIEQELRKAGQTLEAASLDEMETLWQAAKGLSNET